MNLHNIDYIETTKDLAKRIEIHKNYGTKDIDKWMLDLLQPKANIDILDVGCGSGKQCFLFHDNLKGNCNIVGGDVCDELLANAKQENEKRNTKIKFIKLDFDGKFPFPVNSFDLITCCFAIYYSKNIQFTISEMYRILKPNGILFVTGPMPENKQEFYDIIKQATNKPIPPMPGSSRYNSEILSTIKKIFNKTEVHIFKNPLVFKEAEPFVDYTRASLSEDRRLWSNLFKEESFDEIINKIRNIAKERLKKQDTLVMTKVVGGFIAHKQVK